MSDFKLLISTFLFFTVLITTAIHPVTALDNDALDEVIKVEIENSETTTTAEVEVLDIVKTPLENTDLKKLISTEKYVPLYYQTDYPDTEFSKGTVASSGCSMACLAMVATYLTDTEYYPDELAERFNLPGKSNVTRMEYGSEELGLPLDELTYSWAKVVKALKNNQVVIVWVDERTDFADSGHLIVLTGITHDDKILVNDPFEPNYKNIYLKKGFKNGFKQEEISVGMKAAWIYEDKNPSEPTLLYPLNTLQEK